MFLLGFRSAHPLAALPRFHSGSFSTSRGRRLLGGCPASDRGGMNSISPPRAVRALVSPRSSAARSRRSLPSAIALLALVLALIGVTLPAQGAHAEQATGAGVGFSSASGWWIGSWKLDDGRFALCLEPGKPAPTGHHYDFSEVDALPGQSADDAARLAFLARKYGATSDRVTAAAAQLASWIVTGLSDEDARERSQRAGTEANHVYDRAHEMLREANGPRGASRGASATLATIVHDDGTVEITTTLVVDYLAGAEEMPAKDAHGSIHVEGATFADGAVSATVESGAPMTARVTDSAALNRVRIDAAFTDLPYGRGLLVGAPDGDAQLLMAQGSTVATATGVLEKDVPTAKPFQPAVATQTSRTTAAKGDAITDRIRVSTIEGAGLSSEWGRYVTSTGEAAPVPVVVRSSLLGPFAQKPVESASVPAGAPVACTVETHVAAIGEYETPPCTLPETGYYVWVESISPSDTPVDEGQSRIRPWQSRFGVATETTLSPFAPLIDTNATTSTATVGDCVTDTLRVTNVNLAAGDIPLTMRLLGPLDDATDGRAIVDVSQLPTAGTTELTLTKEGEVTTPCIAVDKPGTYAFVFDSPGITAPNGDVIVPGFADHTIHRSETVSVQNQAPAAHREAARELPYTGQNSTLPFMGASAAVLLGLLALVTARIRRRRGVTPARRK